ncbi:MAG: dephospho-CoA kinase [Sulfurovum sp.]|nr:dephospho-CoA kinase [Sulfurovum sp.]
MVFAYAIALTGGIATGKSLVAKMFEADSYRVIDADKIAHAILETQQSKIIEMFGTQMVTNGKVDRKALGTVIFSNPLQRKRLEQLLHPLIYKAIETEASVEDIKEKPYIIDIPLFFERKRYPIHKSLVVYAPQQIQIIRIMQRDGLDRDAALKRIASQIDIEKKRYMGNFIIDNSRDKNQLKIEYKRIKEAIEKEFV